MAVILQLVLSQNTALIPGSVKAIVPPSVQRIEDRLGCHTLF